MPDEEPAGILRAVTVDRGVDEPPEEDRLVDRVVRLGRIPADRVLVGREIVREERRLREERVEVVAIAEAGEARDERRRMADRDHDVHPEAIGKPARGEDGDRILHQRARLREA